MIRIFFTQVMFLTKFPLPSLSEFRDDDLARGVVFAPIVGLMVGILPALAYYYLSGAGLVQMAAVSAVVLNVVLTGALHLDGLADTADGFFSYRSRERILEIMKDSRIGTNGAISLIVIIILKYSILVSLSRESAFIALLAAPAAARMTIAWCAGVSSYARSEQGMGRIMVERTGWREIFITTVVTLALIYVLFGFSLIVLPAAIVLTAAAFALLFSYYSFKKIGGMTGDVIGAVIELSEVLILILFVLFQTIPVLRGI
jgi:adenosylcobinamide-GDP ribazoletransferase